MLNLTDVDYPTNLECPDCGEPAYAIEVQDLEFQNSSEAWHPVVCHACGWSDEVLEGYSQDSRAVIFSEVREVVTELLSLREKATKLLSDAPKLLEKRQLPCR